MAPEPRALEWKALMHFGREQVGHHGMVTVLDCEIESLEEPVHQALAV